MSDRDDDQDEPIGDDPPRGRGAAPDEPPARRSRPAPEPEDDVWDDDDEPVRPRRSRSRDVDEDEDRPARSRSGSGRQSPRDDDPGDFDDEWDDDDDWDRDGAGPGGPKRDLTYVVGIAAVVLLVALIVVLVNKGDNKDKNASNAPTTSATGAPTTAAGKSGGGFCGNLPPQLGGQGKVAVSGPAGVYLWSDFFGVHVRAKGPKATTIKITATAPITVKTQADPKNKQEQKAYDASYAAWNADKAKGASAVVSGNILTITLPASTAPSGPNLDVPCPVTNMTVDVTGPSGEVDASTIHLGDTGEAPRNPFDIQREAN